MTKGLMTRQKILETALELATEVGLESISLGVLAENLRLSKSGLFAHFKSKEALQLAVLEMAREEFVQKVVMPSLNKARGLPRVKAFFDNYIAWIRDSGGACIFMALAQEYDDRTGPIHEMVVKTEKDLYGTFERAVRIAIEEGHFKASSDPEQFVYEYMGISMAYQNALKILKDPKAEMRARIAFDALLARQKR
jgi:AcrR family transcriptional regulator